MHYKHLKRWEPTLFVPSYCSRNYPVKVYPTKKTFHQILANLDNSRLGGLEMYVKQSTYVNKVEASWENFLDSPATHETDILIVNPFEMALNFDFTYLDKRKKVKMDATNQFKCRIFMRESRRSGWAPHLLCRWYESIYAKGDSKRSWRFLGYIGFI